MHVPFRFKLKWIRFRFFLIDTRTSVINRVKNNISTGLFRWLGLALFLITLTACGPFGISIDIEDINTSDETSPDSAVISAPSQEPLATVDAPDVGEPAPDVPDLVWTSFSNGLDESKNLLTIRPDQVGFETSPVDFALYWDYSGATGKLAYASEFWGPARGSNRSVSNLWVYDYESGNAEQWLPDNVSRAAWSPALPGRFAEQRLAAAIYNTEEGRYDIAIVDGPGQVEFLANCASPNFSWSPDGSQIAYSAIAIGDPGDIPAECEGVFLISLDSGEVTQISDVISLSGGWIGNQPIWAEGQDVLLYSEASPESVFWVIPLDGSGAFQIDSEPTQQNTGVEYLPRPMHSLWSAEHRSLVGQVAGMFDPWGVWVYTFAEDMHSIEKAYRVDWGEYSHDIMLIDWWDPGDSVLLRDISNTSALNPFGVAMVWALGDEYAFELSFSRPQIEVPLYPDQVRTGVPAIDSVIENFLIRKFDWREGMIRTLTTTCTSVAFSVGPPQCQEGQAEGSMVEVFPYREHRATKYVSPDELTSFLEFPLGGLYAVYRVPDTAFQEEWAPAGQYGIVFVSAEGELGVEVVVDGEEVVRIEFWPLTPVEWLDGWDVEYILPPLTS
jgi:hypothetical protein